MKVRLALFVDTVRSSYWFVPSLMLIGSAALAIFLVLVDQRVETQKVRGLWWVFSGGAEGARSVLSTVAGSVISVAGTTFSITIAVLSLTSSQFGPRLLRGFLRDTGNQFVLGTFVGTFLYCLLVLRMVRSVEENYFVPHLAVTGGMLLAIASVCVLIYFIHHISVSIQASRIIASVAKELESTIDRLFPDDIAFQSEAPPLLPKQNGEAPQAHSNGKEVHVEGHGGQPILSLQNGYLQALDEAALIEFATKQNVRLSLPYGPGQFLTRGTPLAHVHYSDASTILPKSADKQIQAAFTLGEQRTATQDAEFLLLELVEVASRALSPGINDPFTAVRCIDRLGAAIAHLSSRRLPTGLHYDASGTLRLVVPPVTFAGLVEAAFGEVRHYGQSDPVVAKQLSDVLDRLLAGAANEDQRGILRKEADLL